MRAMTFSHLLRKRGHDEQHAREVKRWRAEGMPSMRECHAGAQPSRMSGMVSSPPRRAPHVAPPEAERHDLTLFVSRRSAV